ncbi:hypothetical protein BDE02_16G022400 [Populus trichocarpa]|nr:hypothetical protein BDE02_16G022400 [Populus trichocarpa]
MLYIVAESKLLNIIRILNFQRAKSLPCQAERHRFFDRHCQLNTFQQLLQFSVYNKMLSEAAESEHILCVVHNSGYLLLEYE